MTVQFREFGIRLKFTPILTDHKTIKIHLNQEVSTLDPGDGVTMNGFVIPALSTRARRNRRGTGRGPEFRGGRPGEQPRDRQASPRIPVLGSLPIIGNLFKSKDEKKHRTDLVVLVTPEITEPLGPTIRKPSIYMPEGLPGPAGSEGYAASRRKKTRSNRAYGKTREMSARVHNEAEIAALLIAPNRELAQQFLATLPQTRAFQILADLKSYPPQQTLEIRARQLKPNVVLLDLATDLAAAMELVRFVTALTPPVHVVGLHTQNDSTRSCNRCAPERASFSTLPFELATQREAIARLRRLVAPEAPAEPKRDTWWPLPAPSPAPAHPRSPRRRHFRCSGSPESGCCWPTSI